MTNSDIEEIWRVIPYTSDFYDASNLGRVRSWKVNGSATRRSNTPLVLSPGLSSTGYLTVTVVFKGKRVSKDVHGLVALAFYGDLPKGYEVCHNDGVRLNNILTNLRQDTAINNQRDKILHGTTNRGERAASAKLTWEKVREIRIEHGKGVKQTVLANKYNMDRSSISLIVTNKRWVESSQTV